MNQQNNTFPLFFTLERVENGYILKCKEESAGLSGEASIRKEIVVEDKIDQRIGHLLKLDTMKKEVPLTFFVEAITENTYKFDDEGIKADDLTRMRLKFYQFHLKNYKDDVVLGLKNVDSNTIEIYGSNAEKLALSNNLNLIRIDGIHMLRFPVTKDIMKQIGTYRPQVTLMTVKDEDIVKWNNTHQIGNLATE